MSSPADVNVSTSRRVPVYKRRRRRIYGVAAVAGELGVDPRSFAATAGEDYELCACVPGRAAAILENARGPRSLEADLTWVGLVVEGEPGVAFVDADGELSGFEHSF